MGSRLSLFQYGSNMSRSSLMEKLDRDDVRECVPIGVDVDVRLIGKACLPQWRFVLDLYSQTNECLVGDIVSGTEDDEVWGAVYDLDRELVLRADGGRSALDAIEGHMPRLHPENYWPMCVTVWLDGDRATPRHAWT